MATEDPTPRNDSLMKNLMGYIDTRIDLVRLEVQEKVKTIFVGVAQGATLAVLGLLFLVFASIFAGLALNAALDSSYWGFGIVAGFYLLVLIIFVVGVGKKLYQGLADKILNETIYKSDKRQ
jgi:uncharacterized membrane protein YqjE